MPSRPPSISDGRTRTASVSDAARRASNNFLTCMPWRRLRKAFLAANPLCAVCLAENGKPTVAEHVHHVKDRATNPELALDWSNLQSLCPSHHGQETLRRQRT